MGGYAKQPQPSLSRTTSSPTKQSIPTPKILSNITPAGESVRTKTAGQTLAKSEGQRRV